MASRRGEEVKPDLSAARPADVNMRCDAVTDQPEGITDIRISEFDLGCEGAVLLPERGAGVDNAGREIEVFCVKTPCRDPMPCRLSFAAWL
jgi:hypothetical protein